MAHPRRTHARARVQAKVDVFAMDLLLVPVHLGIHWCMAIVDLRRKRFEYYDSLTADNDACLLVHVAEKREKKAGLWVFEGVSRAF